MPGPGNIAVSSARACRLCAQRIARTSLEVKIITSFQPSAEKLYQASLSLMTKSLSVAHPHSRQRPLLIDPSIPNIPSTKSLLSVYYLPGSVHTSCVYVKHH